MNNDYKELVEYLDEKFFNIDKKLDGLEDNKADKETADKILVSQDDIITKLDSLLQEKTFSDAQDKRKTKVLKIHNEALKRSKILTDEEALKIAQSNVF